MRITDRDLEAVCARINVATSSPLLPWSPRDGGGMRANVGAYHLDYAYGGVTLHRMESEGGGISTPIGGGYRTKRELYGEMQAYLAGLAETESRRESGLAQRDEVTA